RPERVLEGQRLATERHVVLVVRESAVDRVSDERDQLRLRHERGDAPRGKRVEEIARARLAHVSARPQRIREVAAVPGLAACVVAVEEADLLPGRSRDLRMPTQVGVEGRGTGLLGTDDQE